MHITSLASLVGKMSVLTCPLRVSAIFTARTMADPDQKIRGCQMIFCESEHCPDPITLCAAETKQTLFTASMHDFVHYCACPRVSSLFHAWVLPELYIAHSASRFLRRYIYCRVSRATVCQFRVGAARSVFLSGALAPQASPWIHHWCMCMMCSGYWALPVNKDTPP